MTIDGQIDYQTYSREQLLEALSSIDASRYPINLANLRRELADRPEPNNPQGYLAKRPTVIAVLSVISIVGSVVGIVVVWSWLRPTLQDRLSDSYFTIITTCSVLVLAGSVGTWQMRRWGVYLYAVGSGAGVVVNIADGVTPGLGTYVFPLLYLFVCARYLSRMQ